MTNREQTWVTMQCGLPNICIKVQLSKRFLFLLLTKGQGLVVLNMPTPFKFSLFLQLCYPLLISIPSFFSLFCIPWSKIKFHAEVILRHLLMNTHTHAWKLKFNGKSSPILLTPSLSSPTPRDTHSAKYTPNRLSAQHCCCAYRLWLNMWLLPKTTLLSAEQ